MGFKWDNKKKVADGVFGSNLIFIFKQKRASLKLEHMALLDINEHCCRHRSHSVRQAHKNPAELRAGSSLVPTDACMSLSRARRNPVTIPCTALDNTLHQLIRLFCALSDCGRDALWARDHPAQA